MILQQSNLSESTLNTYLGLDIKDICSNSYHDASENHCAHFVSHVLGLHFGYTCREMVQSGKRLAPGANVRVHEVFAACPNVEELRECPLHGAALIFVSAPSNFRMLGSSVFPGAAPVQMLNVPNKHIGFLVSGRVYHYSNSRDQVIVQILAEFIRHYPKQTNALWIGSFPARSHAIAYGGLTCSAV